MGRRLLTQPCLQITAPGCRLLWHWAETFRGDSSILFPDNIYGVEWKKLHCLGGDLREGKTPVGPSCPPDASSCSSVCFSASPVLNAVKSVHGAGCHGREAALVTNATSMDKQWSLQSLLPSADAASTNNSGVNSICLFLCHIWPLTDASNAAFSCLPYRA